MTQSKFPDDEVLAFCRTHWGVSPDHIDHAGGKDRRTVLVTVKNQRFAIAKRKSPGRAKLEALALAGLAPSGRVPGLIAQDGPYVVQEAVSGPRLTQVLEAADKQQRDALLTEAGVALLEMQAVARDTGLDRQVPLIGARPGWYRDFAAAPFRLAKQLDLPAPVYDVEVVAEVISQRSEAFAKWDSRPGNAFVAGGRSIWFDWEHCGRASVEDDLVWLLADEWSPISEAAFETCLSQAANKSEGDPEALFRRAALKMILHCSIRLSLVFARKAEGPWWNAAEAMEHDRVGVTQAHVARLCKRAKALCSLHDLSKPLSENFIKIQDLIS